MNFDITKASSRLSELDLKIVADNLFVDVSWFRVMQQEGDWKINRHTHSTFEFHFIQSGCCRVLLDDSEFIIGPGEFYITAPHIFHEQTGLGEDGLIEYSLNCDISLCEEKSSESKYILQVLTETTCKKFKDVNGAINLFETALNEAFFQNLGFFNNIKSLVVMIITAAARAIKENASVKYNVPLKAQKDDYRSTQIHNFINDNISYPISTHDIAKYLHLSDKQVCRITREATGMSTKELIERIKFEKAEDLLNNTNLLIKQVSDKLGFSSQYYFNQFFKRMEGYPPGIYRSNIKNDINMS